VAQKSAAGNTAANAEMKTGQSTKNPERAAQPTYTGKRPGGNP